MINRYVRSNAIPFCRGLVAAALALFSLTVNAAYVRGSSPTGWVPKTGSVPSAQLLLTLDTQMQRLERNTVFLNKKHQASIVGRSITYTANYVMRNAEAMGQVAKTLSKNPWGQAVFAAGGVVCATGLCEHMISQGLQWAEGQGWTIPSDEKIASGYRFSSVYGGLFKTPQEAAANFVASSNAKQNSSGWEYRLYGSDKGYNNITNPTTYSFGYSYRRKNGNVWGDWVNDQNTLTVSCPPTIICSLESGQKPISADDMSKLLGEWSQYFDPRGWPEPLPVSDPIFNPSADDPMTPKPLFVPTGDPTVKEVDNGDGTITRTTKTPGVELRGSPSADDPHRLDMQPKDETTTDRIKRDPETGQVTIIESGKPEQKPPEEGKGLCDQYPDILACAQVPEATVPDQDDIDRQEEVITYEPENLFSGGSCPADVYIDVAGRNTLVWNWTRTCSYAHSYARPLILLLATITAVGIVIRRA